MASASSIHDARPRPSASEAFEHELLLVRRGARTGAHTIVAVHSTVRGPALGGCRMWRYEGVEAAIEDALRLAGAMTLKAAAAGLSLGGGQAVIFPPEDLDITGPARRALMHDFADTLNLLDGLYITAEDVGTTAGDMAILAERSRHVTGAPPQRGGSGDPGDFTAAGVQAAMRACARHRFGSGDLERRSVSVVGLGHVGDAPARRLAHAGARLILADIDDSKRRLAAELEAVWCAPEE